MMLTKEIKSKNIKQEDCNGIQKFIVRKINYCEKNVYNAFKRIFDVFSSLCATIVLFIPLIFVAILIKKDSDGPVIYKQERLGRNGKPFLLYKFRTMHTDAEEHGAQWAKKDDERCTKIGSILRKARIDEWPQLINILKGDMSIVGPRPERDCFYCDFRQYIDGFDQRLCVLPGLTGLAQINGGYELKPEEKIVFDIEYIEKRNIFLDIKIILKTIAIVFNHNGAR